MEFLQWLRLVSSSRRAQRLELGVATCEGRVLSPKTCNRIMAAVSSFYEFLIASEGFEGRDNSIVKVADQARVVDLLEGRALPALNGYVMHERDQARSCHARLDEDLHAGQRSGSRQGLPARGR
jgi:hypothetical protein